MTYRFYRTKDKYHPSIVVPLDPSEVSTTGSYVGLVCSYMKYLGVGEGTWLYRGEGAGQEVEGEPLQSIVPQMSQRQWCHGSK